MERNPRKRTKEEREAWNRHVDETIRNLRALAEKGKAELERRDAERRAAGDSAQP